MPFTDELTRKERIGEEFLSDIAIFWCESCHSAQNLTDVHVADYYRDYQYTVSGSDFARKFMSRVAEEAFRQYSLCDGDSVIEVGSGDGYQLKCFQNLGAKVLGFEPSDILTEKARTIGVPTIQTLFTNESKAEIPPEFLPAKLVLLTYTFDHLPDPRGFLDLTRRILDPHQGIVVIEVHDFAKIVNRREICLFEHEHYIYLTSVTMERLLNNCGFNLLSTDLLPENERRGNSLLITAAPKSNQRFPATYSPTSEDLELEKPESILRFDGQVKNGIQRLRDHISKQKSHGRKIAGYGAGGRGVMTLAMAGLDSNDITYLCDQNQSFHGLYTPASHIPVVSPETIRIEPVDEVLVFSYGYMNEIRSTLSEFLRNGGSITSMLDFL
jgi:hypothetical protein